MGLGNLARTMIKKHTWSFDFTSFLMIFFRHLSWTQVSSKGCWVNIVLRSECPTPTWGMWQASLPNFTSTIQFDPRELYFPFPFLTTSAWNSFELSWWPEIIVGPSEGKWTPGALPCLGIWFPDINGLSGLDQSCINHRCFCKAHVVSFFKKPQRPGCHQTAQ